MIREYGSLVRVSFSEGEGSRVGVVTGEWTQGTPVVYGYEVVLVGERESIDVLPSDVELHPLGKTVFFHSVFVLPPLEEAGATRVLVHQRWPRLNWEWVETREQFMDARVWELPDGWVTASGEPLPSLAVMQSEAEEEWREVAILLGVKS